MPSLCRRGNGGSEKSWRGGCSGPERTPQASDSTSLRFRAPGVTPLHLGCGPPPPGSASVLPPRPAWLPQETTLDRRHPWGELAVLCHPSFSEGFLRLMFSASVSSGASPGRLPRAALGAKQGLPRLLGSPLNRAATPHGSGQLSQGPRPPVPANTTHKAHVSPPDHPPPVQLLPPLQKRKPTRNIAHEPRSAGQGPRIRMMVVAPDPHLLSGALAFLDKTPDRALGAGPDQRPGARPSPAQRDLAQGRCLRAA